MKGLMYTGRYREADVKKNKWCGARKPGDSRYVCTQPRGHDKGKHPTMHAECSLDGDRTYAAWGPSKQTKLQRMVENVIAADGLLKPDRNAAEQGLMEFKLPKAVRTVLMEIYDLFQAAYKEDIEELRYQVATQKVIWCDQPEDRLFHASDATWWFRHSDGDPYGADPPPYVIKTRDGKLVKDKNLVVEFLPVPKGSHKGFKSCDKCSGYISRKKCGHCGHVNKKGP